MRIHRRPGTGTAVHAQRIADFLRLGFTAGGCTSSTVTRIRWRRGVRTCAAPCVRLGLRKLPETGALILAGCSGNQVLEPTPGAFPSYGGMAPHRQHQPRSELETRYMEVRDRPSWHADPDGWPSASGKTIHDPLVDLCESGTKKTKSKELHQVQGLAAFGRGVTGSTGIRREPSGSWISASRGTASRRRFGAGGAQLGPGGQPWVG
jgi:hypothetical protein